MATTELPNPFCTLAPARVVQTAAAPGLPDPQVAATDNFVRGFDPFRFLRDIECGCDPLPLPPVELSTRLPVSVVPRLSVVETGATCFAVFEVIPITSVCDAPP